jgi:hypothetical protein
MLICACMCVSSIPLHTIADTDPASQFSVTLSLSLSFLSLFFHAHTHTLIVPLFSVFLLEGVVQKQGRERERQKIVILDSMKKCL